MPITRFLSEPTLRFFMFFLLDKHRDIGFFDSWDFPKRWIGKKIGPFLLTDIVNNNHELEELIQDLEKLGLTEQIIYSSKSSSRECPPASYVHNLEWGNSVFFVEDKKLFQKKWETYVNAFKNDQLSAIQNYWAFSSHKRKMFNIFSTNYLLTRKSTFSVKVEPEPIRYFEFLWVLQQEGECVINDIQCRDSSVLNITLTNQGLKKLQDFMSKQAKTLEKEKTLSEREWTNQIGWGDWSVNSEEKEVRYKGVLVDFKRASKAYKLLYLLVESKKGKVPLNIVINKLAYSTDGSKVDSRGNTVKNTKELIRSKINNLGATIHKKVLDACKKKKIPVNFYISAIGETVQIHRTTSTK